MFSRAVYVSPDDANTALNNGSKSYSTLGKHCPVLNKARKNLSVSQFGNIPVLFGEHVYFLSSVENLKVVYIFMKEFIKRPTFYLSAPPPQPLFFPTICIVGDSKSGKTSLAREIAESLQIVHLTVDSVLQTLLDGEEVTALSDGIKKIAASGGIIPDELLIEAIVLVANRTGVAGKGWVLDGFPFTKKQADLLASRDFIPQNFIQMQLSDQLITQRCAKDIAKSIQTKSVNIDHHDIIQLIQSNYHSEIKKIRDTFEPKYQNWTVFNGEDSIWLLKTKASSLANSSVTLRRNYLNSRSNNKASLVSGIGISKQSILDNIGAFQDYCPVTLKNHHELRKSENFFDEVVEYENKFYAISPDFLDLFLENPQTYVETAELPEKLPNEVSADAVKSYFPKTFELKGFCPVTFAEGNATEYYIITKHSFSSMIIGHSQCVAMYDDKLYAMANKEKLALFLRYILL